MMDHRDSTKATTNINRYRKQAEVIISRGAHAHMHTLFVRIMLEGKGRAGTRDI